MLYLYLLPLLPSDICLFHCLLTLLREDRWDVREGETQTSQFYSLLATLLTRSESEKKRKGELGSQVESSVQNIPGAGEVA